VTLDYRSVISAQTSYIVDAYEHDPTARVPWSDRWTVGTVGRHVAGTHHVVSQIIKGRPTADFGLFASLQTPAKDSPEFLDWFRSGTDALLEQLSSVPAGDACWSWYEAVSSVGWWARRMAFEVLIHRWDAGAAVGQTFEVDPELAADGIDEYLDVFVAASRAGNSSPTGPSVSIECSDHEDRWWLDLSEQGGRNVSTSPLTASVAIRGTAEQLLLFLWGRLPLAEAGIEISGDVNKLDQWSELVPPM
jgi:uncharacterized protein (TIGR03083 family)